MKLSVLIIAYNHERFIRQALESVLAQRVNFEYEIVVAEDCSTDRTRDIVLEFYGRNPHHIVPLLRTKNLGGGRNVIDALDSCRGEYLAFLEGDDYWTYQTKLQKQVDFLDQNPDFALCGHRVQIRDETGADRTGIWPPVDFKAGSYTIKDIIAEDFIFTCSVMYRSDSVLPTPNWFADITVGDWARNILAARSGKIQLMDEVMATYRLHPGGVWTSRRPIDQKADMLRMMTAVDREMHFRYTGQIRRSCARCYFDLAIVERLNGNRMAAVKYLSASLSSGRLQLSGRWRELAALLVYCVLGIRRSKAVVPDRNL